MMCQCPLGLIPHFYCNSMTELDSKLAGVNALSGLYLISTVPLQKPRFYAVSRACFCRYLSEYSDRSSFSCMFTIWTHLTRQIFPNPEFTIAQNYSSVILFFIYTLFNSGEKYIKSAFAPTSHGLQLSDKIWDAGGFVTTFNKPLCSNC